MLGLGSDLRARRAWSAKGRKPLQAKPHRADRFSEGGVEPTLEDLMTDPVTAAIMAYDGVSPATLRSLVERARSALLARPSDELTPALD